MPVSEPLASPMHILWKVDFLDPRRASVRYRALYPAAALEASGSTVQVVDHAPRAATLAEVDAVVFSRSFRPGDLELAHCATSRRIPLVLDPCDNIFADGYGGAEGPAMSGIFQAMARLAAVVVTPTPALTEALRPWLPPGLPVVEIVDPVETPTEAGAMLKRHGSMLGRSPPDKRSLQRYLRRLAQHGRRGLFAAATIARRGTCDPRWLIGGVARRLGLSPPDQVFARGSTDRTKTVVWFGNAGKAYADSGLRSLLAITPDLARVCADLPFRLRIVSNDRRIFADEFSRLPFPVESRAWHPLRIFADIAGCDACVLPNSLDPFSRCESGNHATLALSLGVPVVATPIAALEPLAGCLALEGIEAGLRRYLGNPADGAGDVAAARAILASRYDRTVVGGEWRRLLDDVATRRRAAPADDRLPVLFFLDLVQDLDVVRPVISAARADAGIAVSIWVTGSLAGRSPRVLTQLGALGLRPRIIPGDDWRGGFEAELRRHAALVTGSESTAGPHRRAHALTRLANDLGLATVTLQHGVETVGLTYFDDVHDVGIRFAARQVLTWGPVESLPPSVPAETRAKCFAVGRPVAPPAAVPHLPLPTEDRPCIAVFENLHWHRYEKAYRAAFLADLGRLADAFPHARILVKPHHAGRWLAPRSARSLAARCNVVLVDPAAPDWEPFTAPAIVAVVDAAITTPSTVALDAAQAGCPVAVAAYGLDLPAYAPLPLLHRFEDWRSFVTDVLEGTAGGAAGTAYVERCTLPGDAAGRVLEAIRMAAGRRLAERRARERER